jgi:hypothetical protein
MALFVWLILLAIMTVAGHAIWLALAALIRWVSNDTNAQAADPVASQLVDLAITERQIIQLYSHGKLSDLTYNPLLSCIRKERESLVKPPSPVPLKRTPIPEPRETPVVPAAPISVTASRDEERVIEPAPTFHWREEATPEPEPQREYAPPPPPKQPRRSFSEVLSSFMEESNIRWGEIIGGLLIIGCSTALVVSLWAQISQIPVLKFLIFTTVTAILFGIGLYTEHRWKLPTTSRGILTIATLLVPLNFLAIAAVSASNTSGALVIGSELLAPAIFLCLVYFAGRIITPGCAHILSAGVLGSSIGQLLVRHFASIDASPAVLILLGAFPVACYVVTVALALRFVLADHEISEHETTTIFTALGTMSFAALLPFGLLLYKSGPLSLSMMYLAPLVTLWGLPMLATGTIMWRKITSKELAASRTAGTALGILGVMIVLSGMILAWPNPASIVPAALLNFVVFTTLAVALRLPVAHVIGAICFALAYLVTGHVLAGNITWENLRVLSLLQVSLSVDSGNLLVGAFALFVIASEWLTAKKRERDSYYYFVSACLIGGLSLALVSVFGAQISPSIWIVYGLYALGAFWIAGRRKLTPFSWIGAALLLFSLAHNFTHSSFAFPWQTALFAHATICALAAIFSSRRKGGEIFSTPLNYVALISIVLGVVSLFQANTWQITWMQTQRVFWIAGILLLLLWLNRHRIIFYLFQITLVGGLILAVKGALQEFEWYSYLPHAFLHPAALQIQGTVLALMCVAWLTLRFVASSALSKQSTARENWLAASCRLLNDRYSLDRFVIWFLLGGLFLLAFYGSASGVVRELLPLGSDFGGVNAANLPHQEALALGSWILVGLLTLLMLANAWERRKDVYLLGAIVALFTAIPLLAGLFETQLATATAWRWFAAAFLLSGSLALWYRRSLAQRLARFGWPTVEGDSGSVQGQGSPTGLITKARILLTGLTVLPIISLTAQAALWAMERRSVQGPVSGFFSLLGDDLSYGVPLLLVAAVMIGYALRERMPEHGLYAGAFLNLTVSLAYLLAVVTSGGSLNQVFTVRLLQLNALTCAVYLLPWLITRHRWRSVLDDASVRFSDYLLKLQLGMAIALNLFLVLPVLVALVQAPDGVEPWPVATGSPLGWLTFFTIVLTTAWFAINRTIRLTANSLAGLFLALSCMIALSASGVTGWIGLHTLTVCVTVTACLMLGAAEISSAGAHGSNWMNRVFDLGDGWQSRCRQLAAIIGGAAVALSLRTLADVEISRWWSIGPLLAICALAAVLNWKTQRRRYLYSAGLLFNLAVSLWCIFIVDLAMNYDQFFLFNLIGMSLAGVLWLWLELRARQRGATPLDTIFSFHHIIVIASLAILALLVWWSFYVSAPYSTVLKYNALSWTAFFSVLIFFTACLWDRYAKYAVAGLYVLGLLACAIALRQLELTTNHFLWSTTIFLAVYTIFVALLWHWRARLIAFAKQFGIPERVGAEVAELKWLAAVSILAVVIVGSLAYWINIDFFEPGLRGTAALAVAAQFLTFGLLAEGVWEQRWRRAALAIFVVGAVLLVWSWLTPGVNATWLNRSVILMLETFGLTALYGWALSKAKARWPQWTNSAHACVPWLVGAGAIALFFCLGTEIFYQLNFGAVLINPLSLFAIGATLLAAVVICVLFALSAAHDPLGLTERGRMKYVYAAEVLLALLCLHVRLTMPWLFTGFIERYWPLVVMVIAYVGIVTSEALRRRDLLVLASPLERTGVFIPLLPVLGFWLASSQVDFSLLLFTVGGLYGLLSILRRSFGFGILAAIAGNGGLWYILHRTDDYQFLQHPQLWLIPAALSVLLAAYLNEDKFTEDQMTGVRYLSLVTIYVSSTADIFINGVANSPWLPLILGSFSLAGIFAGISFRIRGLLLLGAIFLLLSITTMIWYASANFGWTWLWYVAGIATGATIIFMFALFEKKRGDVLRVVDGLREWER